MRRHHFNLLGMAIAFAVVCGNGGFAQSSTGPAKGALVITGGEFGKGVIERFVALAGGHKANFVYVPTAASSLRLPSGFIYDPPNSEIPAANTKEFEQELSKFFGVSHVTVLHTRDRKTANTDAFVSALRQANGVWFSSGNAGRLADAYLDTLTQREIVALLARGGVVGGNSAGAIIQGSYTVCGRPDKPLLMAEGHERGFGLITNVAIDPHLTEQKRDAELVNVIDRYPQLLGIGIDEKAAIVVQGSVFEVIGEDRVAIYDNVKHGGNWYYWLKPGDKFDLQKRKIFDSAVVRLPMKVRLGMFGFFSPPDDLIAYQDGGNTDYWLGYLASVDGAVKIRWSSGLVVNPFSPDQPAFDWVRTEAIPGGSLKYGLRTSKSGAKEAVASVGGVNFYLPVEADGDLNILLDLVRTYRAETCADCVRPRPAPLRISGH